MHIENVFHIGNAFHRKADAIPVSGAIFKKTSHELRRIDFKIGSETVCIIPVMPPESYKRYQDARSAFRLSITHSCLEYMNDKDELVYAVDLRTGEILEHYHPTGRIADPALIWYGRMRAFDTQDPNWIDPKWKDKTGETYARQLEQHGNVTKIPTLPQRRSA